ncbi:hypothetical protein BC827DRAFT_1247911 [Russula dissimulans]|nr:hypothetical protein BC827DRAFT_1247911 [Russula dissimulans]
MCRARSVKHSCMKISRPQQHSVYVEMNSDNRCPIGRDEDVLRHTVGLKKSEYSLDKKSASKVMP